MLERVIENWLDKASEKSFQVPFCYMLIQEGHTIIHLTRHTLTEFGKDIIPRDPDGNICAFQLKGAPGGRIGYEKYRSEILPQLMTLTSIPVTHPSIQNDGKYHKSYFVTNGYLEEEVGIAIATANAGHVRNGLPHMVVETILRGEMLAKAAKIKLEFLPSDLRDFNVLLELYLEDGTGMINKHKIATLLESLYHKDEFKAKEKRELISSVAIIIALITANHTNEANHLALVEAWTMFLSYTYEFIEANDIAAKFYEQEIQIAFDTILNELEDLTDEVLDDPHLLQPSGPAENLIYSSKMTWILGFLAFLGTHYSISGNEGRVSGLASFLRQFEQVIHIYGEAAFAPMLSYYWFCRKNDKGPKPLESLKILFNTAIAPMRDENADSSVFLPDPYQGVEECLINRFSEHRKIENSKFESHYAESLIELLIREDQKWHLQQLWKPYSRILIKSFRYDRPGDRYQWRTSRGHEVSTVQPTPQSWSVISKGAQVVDDGSLPNFMKKNPLFIPVFLMVYPHRIDKEMVKFFDNWLRKGK
ncbi:hypothetical protein SNE25_21335 [Mucilaginibacter sabulilitoris]|uniref:DUF4365 domain-containing protein n=1 Tax=Mucilaginibacter sabulilitoris TaxID=1173583 RepID=A0ABZ0TI22_9SPHI|nr:hypothetical protein [Mucilaginibacter sabulilitoris]WPU91863.1 hypothetical protein SNE25_21335 [Mucilaginibacter sabulilitoris]